MKNKYCRYLIGWLLTMLIIVTTNSCTMQHNNTSKLQGIDLDSIVRRGELHVLTLSGSTSYFHYKGQERGYEYELIKKYADSHNLDIKVSVADNLAHLTQMLLDGEGDVIAYEMPIIGDTKDLLLYCGPERVSEQVLVQRNDNPLSDVVQLVGKDVYVERDSKYEERLRNLNDELGGGINIHCINRDTIVTEDLIEMVAKGDIPYTLADANLARINRTYYNNIDIYVKVSFPQRMRWAVRHDSPQLAQSINEWTQQCLENDELKYIAKRYFEMSKQMTASSILSLADGRISPYDEIFKQEAAKIGWDWRLLAAMAYHESRFDPTVVSWVGARGIMQLMPATAAAFGLSIDSIADPQANVATAVKSIKAVENSIRSVEERDEKIKFVLAAYNSGLGHVFDAIALAKKYDKNPQIWYGQVEEAMLMKGNPAYYNDEVCRFGYFRGRQTTTYVREVMSLYNYYCSKIPR